MLATLKRWFSRAGGGQGATAIARWADERGHRFRRARDGEGFVIDSVDPHLPWRIEWGPSQRPYIAGNELRLRGELAGAPQLQMLLLSLSLMEAMEKEVFEQYTEDLQTRVDTATPEEMRWLVLFQKLPAAELRTLRDSFGAVAASPKWLLHWLEGGLTLQLQQARSNWLAPDDPFVLMAHRGRLTLRLAMPQPDVGRVASAVSLFEVALRETLRVAELWTDSTNAASTQPSLWHSGGEPSAGAGHGQPVR